MALGSCSCPPQELYTQPYETIEWRAQRSNVCPADVFKPHSGALDALYALLGVLDPLITALPGVRAASLAFVHKLVVMEDENTACQTLGPVSKMLNQLVRFATDGPGSPVMRAHTEKRQDFMWLGAQGMMMTGTNGSQLWDIAFISQAFVESGLADDPTAEVRESLTKALGWLEQSQMTEDPIHYEEAYRHTTKGAWPFSTKEQGYTVSDCTGEGLKAVIYLQDHLRYAVLLAFQASRLIIRVSYTPKLVSERRMCDAVDVLLSMQNASGAYASYELIRGPLWLEALNPAEVFGDIMTEFPYPECTTSAITALSVFRTHNPTYRAAEIDRTIRAAVAYIHAAQQPHGGWVGSWGICFTYASQFALESLALVGETYGTSARVKKACEFLLSHQRADGGWGESYKVRGVRCSRLVRLTRGHGRAASSASGSSTSRRRSCRRRGRRSRSSTRATRSRGRSARRCSS
jgi:lanosterol synthase